MPHFCRLTCGPIGRSLCRVLSTWSTNDCVIHSHWIYIQRPACTFNLLSSSSSAAGTTCSRLLLLPALLSMLRCEALLHRWPGHPSTPPHLLFFSTDCRTTPHQNQLTLIHLSFCDYSRVFPSPACCCPGPRRRPPPWMRSARRGQHGQRTTPSEVDCAWRG